MDNSMVVALSRTTADGRTLFGHNSVRPVGEAQSLLREPGRPFTLGETVTAGRVTLPQERRSFTVLGNRSAGAWGYQHGVNEHGVAAGTAARFSRVGCARPGFSGPDLVRLVLERASTALHGVDVATDLIARHGQGNYPGGDEADSSLLIADAREAYLVAATGPHWAVQEVAAVRAVTNVCQLRQDWDRISPGLADLVLHNGWWPEDGSKIDFECTVSANGGPSTAGLRRWGHATLLLEEQIGHIDGHFLRRLLADHYEGCFDEADPIDPHDGDNTLCRHAVGADGPEVAVSMIADLGGESRAPLAWWAFGPPCQSVYFPVVFEGELPDEFSSEGSGAIDSVWRRLLRLTREVARAPGRRQVVCAAMSALQARFDRATAEYLDTAGARGDPDEVQRRATAFMQHNLEHFEETWLTLMEGSRADQGLAATPG